MLTVENLPVNFTLAVRIRNFLCAGSIFVILKFQGMGRLLDLWHFIFPFLFFNWKLRSTSWNQMESNLKRVSEEHIFEIYSRNAMPQSNLLLVPDHSLVMLKYNPIFFF